MFRNKIYSGLVLYWIIFISHSCTVSHQKINIDHAALEERRQQRKKQGRRENEDEARSRVRAKARAKVPWEGLAYAPGKGPARRTPETSGCVSCSATTPSPAAWSRRPARPPSPSPPWRGRAGGGTTRRAGPPCGGCKDDGLSERLSGIASREGT